MTTYKCAYCDWTGEVDPDDDAKDMGPNPDGEHSFQKPSDFHEEFRQHVLNEHPGMSIERVRV